MNYLAWINEAHGVPDEGDASPLYLKAFKLLKGSSSQDSRRVDVDRLLRDNAEALSMLREASGKPACFFRFVPRLDEFVERPFGEPSIQHRFRQAFDLFRQRVRANLKAGDVEAAMQDVTVLLAITHHRFGQPSAMDYLEAVNGAQLTYRLLREVVADLENAEQASTLLTMINRYRSPGPEALHLEIELAKAFHRLQYHLKDSDGDGKCDVWVFVNDRIPLDKPVAFTDAVQEVVDRYERWRKIVALPVTREGTSRSTAFAEELDRTERAFDEFSFPRVDGLIPIRVETLAMQRGVCLAAALAYHRLKEGKWAASLDDVTRYVPGMSTIDPHGGGEPFRLAERSGGLVLYSVGLNGVDDGGREDAHGKGDLILWESR